jgi:hypothetical protein
MAGVMMPLAGPGRSTELALTRPKAWLWFSQIRARSLHLLALCSFVQHQRLVAFSLSIWRNAPMDWTQKRHMMQIIIFHGVEHGQMNVSAVDLGNQSWLRS